MRAPIGPIEFKAVDVTIHMEVDGDTIARIEITHPGWWSGRTGVEMVYLIVPRARTQAPKPRGKPAKKRQRPLGLDDVRKSRA